MGGFGVLGFWGFGVLGFWVAHFFIKSGYEVKLSTDPLNEPDILVTLEKNKKLAVECKCLYSENKIKKNIREGNKQILKREKFYGEKGIKIRGLIALDITNLLPSGIVFNRSVSVGVVRGQHKKILEEYVEAHENDFVAGQVATSYGVMCESGFLIKMTKEGNINYGFQTCHEFIHYANHGFHFGFLIGLAKKFDV